MMMRVMSALGVDGLMVDAARLREILENRCEIYKMFNMVK